MNKKKLALSLLITIFLTSVSAYAEEQIPSYDMEEIIISADADRQAVSTSEVNVKIVNPGSVKTVPELLRRISGLNIQMRTSYDNQDSTVKMRGLDAKRYTVLIDGRPMNMSGVMGGSFINWNNIPLDTIERIRIIRGAKSAAHGNTVGGVIHIITKDYKEPGGQLDVGFGENGAYQYRLNYGATDRKVTWSVYGNKFGRDAFLRNNDYDADQYGLAVKFQFTADDSLKFSFDKTEERRGRIIPNYPGSGNYDPSYPLVPKPAEDNEYPYPGSYWDRAMNTYTTTYHHNTKQGFLDLTYWKNNEKRREFNYDEQGMLVEDKTIPADQSSGWLLAGQSAIGKHTYGYGTEFKRMRYKSGWYKIRSPKASDIYPSQKADLFGLYVEDTWKLNNRWTGNIGLRYDKIDAGPDDPRAAAPNATPSGQVVPKIIDYSESGVSPKFNFSFRNNEETTTFISVTRLWRAPSMPEFYWWSNNRQGYIPGHTANTLGKDTMLKAEKGWGYEIGVEKKVSPAFTAKLTGYYQDIDDYINFTHKYPFSCYNISNAKIWGFEWENTYKLNNIAEVYLNYTNLHTKKEGVNSADRLGLQGTLDYSPRHKVSLGYTYDSRPWLLNYSMDYTSDQTANFPYGTVDVIRLGGYVVHNISATRNLNEDSSITLSIANLLDKEYAEQNGYPMQGRIFSADYRHKL